MTTKQKKPLKVLFLSLNDEGKNNQPEIVEIAKDNQLREMQALVEGLIQPIDLSNNTSIYVNEEGRNFMIYPNWFASSLWFDDLLKLGFEKPMQYGPLVGNAFITGGLDRFGNTMSISAKQIKAVLDVWEPYDDNVVLVNK